MVNRKVILATVAVLSFAVMVGIIYAAIINSRPIPEDVRNTANAPLDDVSGKTSIASEKKSSGSRATPQQVGRPSLDASPAPSQTNSAASHNKDKFSGTWILDSAKSEGLEPGMNQVMVVTRTADIMTVKTTVSTPTRDAWTLTDSYTLNGQETQFTAQASMGAAVKGIRIARQTNDGSNIEVSEWALMEKRGASAKVMTTRRWMLNGDKSLVIEMDILGANANLHHKRVFVKQ